MINFTYTEDENKYRIQMDDLVVFSDDDLPLHAEFRKVVNGEIGWEHDLSKNHWVEWKGGDVDYDVFVYTKRGKLVFERPFNVALDGNKIEKTFHFFIQHLGHRPRGIVIGPHNGEFGHWVYDVIADKTDVIFVEGTNAHLDELKKNYGHLPKVKFLNEIVTADGAPIEWYEGDKGYTNTARKEVISKYLKDDQITNEMRDTISINDLIKREMDISRMGPALDWLHVDVEGLDCELIQALEYEPSLIILEVRHAHRQEYFKLLDWMQEHDYKMFSDGLDAIAIKNNYFNFDSQENLSE